MKYLDNILHIYENILKSSNVGKNKFKNISKYKYRNNNVNNNLYIN